MRKLFWCSVAVAVAAAGSVYLASKSVEHSPTVTVGEALVSLGGGVAGEGVTVAGVPVGLPEDPTAVTMAPVEINSPETATPEVVAVADPSRPGHILIEDPAGSTEGMPGVATTGLAQPVPSALALAGATPAPTLMPYCRDEENGDGRMPYAEEEECEAPLTGSSKGKEDEAWELLRQAAREAVGETATTEEEQSMDDETACPQDHGHGHHGCPDHQMVCPYTGRSYQYHRISPPAPEEPTPAPKNNNEEKKEIQRSESRKMSPPELDDETDLGDLEEQELPTFHTDTMEFRPSDAGFQPMLRRPF